MSDELLERLSTRALRELHLALVSIKDNAGTKDEEVALSCLAHKVWFTAFMAWCRSVSES